MPQFHPALVTLTESDPSSIEGYRISAESLDGTVELAAANYPGDPSGTTVVPIGSNGFFTSVPVGTQFNLFVMEYLGAEHGPKQLVNPYTLTQSPDGAESIVVTY